MRERDHGRDERAHHPGLMVAHVLELEAYARAALALKLGVAMDDGVMAAYRDGQHNRANREVDRAPPHGDRDQGLHAQGHQRGGCVELLLARLVLAGAWHCVGPSRLHVAQDERANVSHDEVRDHPVQHVCLVDSRFGLLFAWA